MCYITFPAKIAYVHIPKTAGTTVTRYLRSLSVETFVHILPSFGSDHNTGSDLKTYLGSSFEDFYTFATVRDPWSLHRSAYLYWKKYECKVVEDVDFKTFVNLMGSTHQRYKIEQFKYLTIDGKPTSPLVVKKLYAIQNIGEMEKDIKEICASAGTKIDENLCEKTNCMVSDPIRDHLDAIDDECAKLIFHLCQKDILFLEQHCPNALDLPRKKGWTAEL